MQRGSGEAGGILQPKILRGSPRGFISRGWGIQDSGVYCNNQLDHCLSGLDSIHLRRKTPETLLEQRRIKFCLRSSGFRFLLAKRDTREGMGRKGAKKLESAWGGAGKEIDIQRYCWCTCANAAKTPGGGEGALDPCLGMRLPLRV